MIRPLLLLTLAFTLTGTLLANDGEAKTRTGDMVFRDPVLYFKMDDREEQLGAVNDGSGVLASHGLSASNYQQNTREGESGTKDVSTITVTGAQGFTLTLTNKQHVPVTRAVSYVNGQPVFVWSLVQPQ